MKKRIGAWGKTVLYIRMNGGEAFLELIQMPTSQSVATVRLGQAEICAIAGLADALGFDYKQYSAVMMKRLESD